MRPRPLAAAALLVALGALPGLPVLSQVAPRPWTPPAQPAKRAKPGAAATPAAPVAYLPDSTVMIRVAGDPVRAGEIIFAYFDGYRANQPNNDSLGRVQYLQTFVNQRLLGKLARDVNPPLDFTARARLREEEGRVLSNALFVHQVEDSVRVDTSEVRKLYWSSSTERHLRLMTIADRATAEKIRAALVGHRLTWVEAYLTAYRGIHQPDQGDLGWISTIQETDLLSPECYRLKSGEVAPLWQDIGGWNLVQCLETRRVNPMLYEGVKARYGILLHNQKAAEIAGRMQARLRERIHAVYDTTNVVWVANRFDESNPRRAATTMKIGVHVPQIAPDDTGRVLVRYDGGQMSMDAFMHAYTATPPMARALLNSAERVRRQLDTVILESVQGDYAREIGLDRDSTVRASLERRREALMVDKIYADSIEARIRVTREMSRAYYDRNTTLFMTYPSVRYSTFLTEGKREADSLADRLRKGTPPEQVIREDAAAGRKRGRVGTMTSQDEGQDFYAALFQELRPGQVAVEGPDDSGKYMVLQSITFDAGHQLSFEEASGYADQAVHDQEADRLMNALLIRLRARYPVEWHPELVMRLRWRDPTLPQM